MSHLPQGTCAGPSFAMSGPGKGTGQSRLTFVGRWLLKLLEMFPSFLRSSHMKGWLFLSYPEHWVFNVWHWDPEPLEPSYNYRGASGGSFSPQMMDHRERERKQVLDPNASCWVNQPGTLPDPQLALIWCKRLSHCSCLWEKSYFVCSEGFLDDTNEIWKFEISWKHVL